MATSPATTAEPKAEKPKRHIPKQAVRGGFCVIRRGDSSHRLMMKNRHLYEHASLDAAKAEAERLATTHNREFAVFQEVAAVAAPAKISEAA